MLAARPVTVLFSLFTGNGVVGRKLLQNVDEACELRTNVQG